MPSTMCVQSLRQCISFLSVCLFTRRLQPEGRRLLTTLQSPFPTDIEDAYEDMCSRLASSSLLCTGESCVFQVRLFTRLVTSRRAERVACERMVCARVA